MDTIKKRLSEKNEREGRRKKTIKRFKDNFDDAKRAKRKEVYDKMRYDILMAKKRLREQDLLRFETDESST